MNYLREIITESYIASQGVYETFWKPGPYKSDASYNVSFGNLLTISVDSHQSFLDPRMSWGYSDSMVGGERVIARSERTIAEIILVLDRLDRAYEKLKMFVNDYCIPHLYKPHKGRMWFKLLKSDLIIDSPNEPVYCGSTN